MSAGREISHLTSTALAVHSNRPDNPTVHDHYRALIAAGWTQHAIATASNVSKRQLRRIEAGHDATDTATAAILAIDHNRLSDDQRHTSPGHAGQHIRDLLNLGASGSRIADAANVSHSTISSLRNGRSRSITVAVERRILAISLDQVRSTRPNAGRPPGIVAALTDGPGRWTAHAACAGHDLDHWFPVSKGAGRNGIDRTYLSTVARAKSICATCPVLNECRAYIDANPQDGIWAGTTEKERRHAKRGAA